jgi:AAA+ superfamily predicted ATPase
MSLAGAQSVTHSLQPAEQVNVQRVVDRWASEESPIVEPLGFTASEGFFGDDNALVRALLVNKLIQAPVERESLPCAIDETFDGVARGLYLLRRNEVPVVIAFRSTRSRFELPSFDVIAPTREAARTTLAAVNEEARRDSVYKGRAISVEKVSALREEVTVRFHEIRPTSRDDIVLPEEVLQVIERNVLGMFRHSEALRASGRSVRRGLLFHGPPGTGKTMMVRYLCHACRNHTVVLLTRSQSLAIREACQIARLLAPSIVVLEDVDVLAEDRQTNRCPLVLHELLNEMDGLGPRDDVTFILTTNRPEVLEPALAGRPGRIDQAVAFPIPDEAGRRRLFALYGRGLDLAEVNLGEWVSQTAGTSPAFIEELLRKAALIAAERNGSMPLKPTDNDLGDAMQELVLFGGELTQRLLGYRPIRIGFQSAPP